MNAEEQKRFERDKYWIDNGGTVHLLELMWLISMVEKLQEENAKANQKARCAQNCADNFSRYLADKKAELSTVRQGYAARCERYQAQLAKVKAQRDRLAEIVDNVVSVLNSVEHERPIVIAEVGRILLESVKKDLAELEKKT